MAAVLSSGDDALLSYGSAAALWGIARYAGTAIEITVPCTKRRRRAGIRLHGDLVASKDRALSERIPVTSVARTLLDLARAVDGRKLARAVEEAERLELLDLAEIERLCSPDTRRAGLPALRAALLAVQPLHVMRSELEREFLLLCRESDLAPPSLNSFVEGFEVDALWEAERLIVELDGFEFHKTRAAFERDRSRDASLQLAGYRVIRVTARRLRDDPDAVMATIGRLLASRPTF